MKKLTGILMTLALVLCLSLALGLAAPTAVDAAENDGHYLTFSSPEKFTLRTENEQANWNDTLEYSTDTVNWTKWDGKLISSSADGKLYLRGMGNHVITGENQDKGFDFEGENISCTGNIESLLDYRTAAAGNHPPMSEYCFAGLFSGNYSLISAPELPSEFLSPYCYEHMFSTTKIAEAPELPAVELAEGCYGFMFYGCIELKTAPELNCTELADFCYWAMFGYCTSLEEAPKLPATKLTSGCYYAMFTNCYELEEAPELPAETLSDNCYMYMFEGCKNLKEAPALPAKTVPMGAYAFMFSECDSIRKIPKLPATTLDSMCYMNMFAGSGVKLSETKTGSYTKAWKLPAVDTAELTDWNTGMFSGTGGRFEGDPVPGKTYYYDSSVAPKLEAPVITLSNSASSGGIKVSWKAVDGAEKYEVWRANSKDGTYTKRTTTSKLSYTNTTTTPGKTYFYKVKAVAGENKSVFSEAKYRTADLPRPTVTLTNVSSSGKIKLVWKKIDGATKYVVYRATSRNGTYYKKTTTTATSYIDSASTAGKTYYYKVKAIHKYASANSANSSLKYRTADLKKPVITKATLSGGKPKIYWKEVSKADRYYIYRATTKSGTYSKIGSTTREYYIDKNAKKGKGYYYKIVAVYDKTSAANSAKSSYIYKKATK